MPQTTSGIIPEPAFTYLALIVSSLTIGYWIGLGKSLGYTRGNHQSRRHEHSLESSDPEFDDHDQTSEKADWLAEDGKLVLVVRSDLGMTKGKIAAQCSHATLACYKVLKKSNPRFLRHWEKSGQAKIALKLETSECESQEDEMDLLKSKARSLGLVAQDICDAGRTQIAAGSKTVLGIGPGPVGLINQITRHLKLL